MSKQKKQVALVRGNSLNNWEGSLWNGLLDDFDITGFCTRGNLYPTDGLQFPVMQLGSEVDRSLSRYASLYLNGTIQHMRGLEKFFSSTDIVHTSEVQYSYTAQAVEAQKINPNLKVVVTV